MQAFREGKIVMVTALTLSGGGDDAPSLSEDLSRFGIEVVGNAESSTLVQMAVRSSPDLLVCFDTHPGEEFFTSLSALRDVYPCPMIVFTTDPDAEKIVVALDAGVHAYVINGYGQTRLRSVLHLAKARFERDARLRDTLSDLRQRFEERKLVDRAKGILMRVRNVSEDEAYRILRSAAMPAKQRIGQIAQEVIGAARYAEAVNRSGQLRMLSQRVVLLYALGCRSVMPQAATKLRAASETIDQNIAILGRILSRPTFGDLIDAVAKPWLQLKDTISPQPIASRLAEVDILAEKLLDQADALTRTLESAGFAAGLRVVNISGRQRMLSQRMAKIAIMANILDPGTISPTTGEPGSSIKDFDDGLTFLQAIPLSSPEIRSLLAEAIAVWARFKLAVTGTTSPSPIEIAGTSEELLGRFDDLTTRYERAVQALLGPRARSSSLS